MLTMIEMNLCNIATYILYHRSYYIITYVHMYICLECLRRHAYTVRTMRKGERTVQTNSNRSYYTAHYQRMSNERTRENHT